MLGDGGLRGEMVPVGKQSPGGPNPVHEGEEGSQPGRVPSSPVVFDLKRCRVRPCRKHRKKEVHQRRSYSLQTCSHVSLKLHNTRHVCFKHPFSYPWLWKKTQQNLIYNPNFNIWNPNLKPKPNLETLTQVENKKTNKTLNPPHPKKRKNTIALC